MAEAKTSSSERLFEIPELASTICRLLTLQDCARLLRVCRSLFVSSRAFVWKNVPAAIHLLRLIPGILDDNDGQEMQLATTDLARFLLYAPCVNNLEISPASCQKPRLENTWNSVDLLARPTGLLPNLRILTYASLSPSGEDHIIWLHVFLGASIRQITISSFQGQIFWQTLSSASRLLRAIAVSCPQLEVLRLHPGEPIPGSGYRTRDGVTCPESILFAEDGSTIHKTMGLIRNLHALNTSPAVLEPKTFRALSTLPHLETLIIESTGDGGPRYHEYNLSDGSFPALRSLKLLSLDPHAIEQLCSLDPLVRGLADATITMDECGDDVTVWDYHGSRSEIMRNFGTRCQQLTHWRFNTGELDPGFSLCHRTLDIFRSLSLQLLNITYVDWDTLTKDRYAVILQTLPCVEDLRFPIATVEHDFLRHAAIYLPRLRYLELSSVDLENFDVGPESSDFTKPPNQSQIPVRVRCDFDMGERTYDEVARYLYALWPKVRLMDKWEGLGVHGGLSEPTRQINRILFQLRRAEA